MNIDEILLEWSYRLPNGYPTVVNGRFVDNKEIAVLNQILEENSLPAYQQQQSLLLEEIAEEDFDEILSTKTLADLEITSRKLTGSVIKQLILYISDIRSSDRKPLLLQIAKDTGGSYVDKYSSAGAVQVLVNGVSLFILLKVDKEDKTSTNVKEGTPSILCQLDGIEPATQANVEMLVKKIIDGTKSDIMGVDEATREEVSKFYQNLINSPKIKLKSVINLLNESISQSLSFKVFLNINPDFRIERADLFDRIRQAASKIVGGYADKWCPGDIYFIRNGSESQIDEVIKEALSRENQEEGLALLNSMFSTIEDFDQKVDSSHTIVAVSLKESRAQAGKLKSAFKQYEGTPSEYNITTDEFNMPAEVLKEKIQKYIDTLSEYIAGDPSTDYIYEKANLDGIDDVRVLKGKYAAYKALNFIMTKVAKATDKLDDALVALVGFGFGLVKVGNIPANPPFLKLVSDRSGKPTKPQYFEPGRTLALLSLKGDESPAQILIRDSETYAGLQVILALMLTGAADERIKYTMNFRYNGNKQITIELGKPESL